jgi:hypothetical protein
MTGLWLLLFEELAVAYEKVADGHQHDRPYPSLTLIQEENTV